MFEKIIHSIAGEKYLSVDDRSVKLCCDSLANLFGSNNSEFILKEHYIDKNCRSFVNLIVEPSSNLDNLFDVDEEIADIWHIINGIHHYQLIQLFRFKEVTVARF